MDLNPDLVKFIVKLTNLNSDQIKPELQVAEDLGFYGLDAISFFEEFFTTFSIENLEEFDADLHIDGGPDFAPQPIKWLRNIFSNEHRKYLSPDVTIGHLQKVIEKGKWFNER